MFILHSPHGLCIPSPHHKHGIRALKALVAIDFLYFHFFFILSSSTYCRIDISLFLHRRSWFLLASMAYHTYHDFSTNSTNLYYLHPNDNPPFILVSPLLDDKNYHSCSRSMHIALISKNKEKFIDGSLTKLLPQILFMHNRFDVIPWSSLGFIALFQNPL